MQMEKIEASGKVKNLIFDLGGVIMDLRRENCVDALTRLGVKGADELLGLYCQSGLFLHLEEGRITPAEFRDGIRKMAAMPLSDEEIDTAFNQFLVGIPVHRLRMLESLRKTYKVFMLSNTNTIMYDSRIAEEFRKDGKTVDDYFDGVCLSFREGCVKPDPRIFKALAEENGIKPGESVFFDDSAANIEAAAALGFGTRLVAPGEDFTDAF